jgi:hypothetical protein
VLNGDTDTHGYPLALVSPGASSDCPVGDEKISGDLVMFTALRHGTTTMTHPISGGHMTATERPSVTAAENGNGGCPNC